MDTLQTEEPANQETIEDTPELDPSEENVEEENNTQDDTSEDEKQEDAADLRKRLSDKDRYIKELEKRNKEPEKKKVKPDTRSKEIQELEWKIENKDRIDLVKEEYENILVNGYNGEMVSKKIALELAEKMAKIDSSEKKRARQDDMTIASTTNRNVDPKGYEDELDRTLGLTAEKKRKLESRHPHLLE